MSSGLRAVNNPLEILQTLDRYLSKDAELTLFGRSALALGYADSPPEYAGTLDVDGIIPLTGSDPDEDFWTAQQATNEALKSRGLYITHLFSEMDIILQPDWLMRRVPVALDLKKLKIFRPATIDLILTKMARGDEQDLEDVQFMLSTEPLSPDQLRVAFNRARVPDVQEIRDLFRAAQPKVLRLAGASRSGSGG
jgi:hypothetical protein